MLRQTSRYTFDLVYTRRMLARNVLAFVAAIHVVEITTNEEGHAAGEVEVLHGKLDLSRLLDKTIVMNENGVIGLVESSRISAIACRRSLDLRKKKMMLFS